MERQPDLTTWHINRKTWYYNARTDEFVEHKEKVFYDGFKSKEEAICKLDCIEKEAKRRVEKDGIVNNGKRPYNGFMNRSSKTQFHAYLYNQRFVFTIKKPQIEQIESNK